MNSYSLGTGISCNVVPTSRIPHNVYLHKSTFYNPNGFPSSLRHEIGHLTLNDHPATNVSLSEKSKSLSFPLTSMCSSNSLTSLESEQEIGQNCFPIKRSDSDSSIFYQKPFYVHYNGSEHGLVSFDFIPDPTKDLDIFPLTNFSKLSKLKAINTINFIQPECFTLPVSAFHICSMEASGMAIEQTAYKRSQMAVEKESNRRIQVAQNAYANELSARDIGNGRKQCVVNYNTYPSEGLEFVEILFVQLKPYFIEKASEIRHKYKIFGSQLWKDVIQVDGIILDQAYLIKNTLLNTNVALEYMKYDLFGGRTMWDVVTEDKCICKVHIQKRLIENKHAN